MLEVWLDKALEGGASYADVRMQSVERTSLEMKDGELKEAVEGQEAGFGLRVLVDGSWGFASANSVIDEQLETAVSKALSMARASAGRAGEPVVLAPVPVVVDEVIWRPAKDSSCRHFMRFEPDVIWRSTARRRHNWRWFRSKTMTTVP